jgi:hypothetical protein
LVKFDGRMVSQTKANSCVSGRPFDSFPPDCNDVVRYCASHGETTFTRFAPLFVGAGVRQLFEFPSGLNTENVNGNLDYKTLLYWFHE